MPRYVKQQALQSLLTRRLNDIFEFGTGNKFACKTSGDFVNYRRKYIISWFLAA
jgi:hypothetical protein